MLFLQITSLFSGFHVRSGPGQRFGPRPLRTGDQGTCEIPRDLVLHETGLERRDTGEVPLPGGRLTLQVQHL